MKKRYLLMLMACLSLIGLLTGCRTQDTAQDKDDKITVMASLDVYGEVARAVLKNQGHVQTIINKPSMDPHDFEPTTQTAKQIAESNLIIYNGLGYDGWMSSLLKASSDKIPAINVAKDVAHQKDGANEHVWYDPDNMIQLTKQLVKRFSKQDPKHAKTFEKNGQAYIKKLTTVNDKLATLKANKIQDKVAVTEPVFDYMLQKMAYQTIDPEFAQAIEEGTDPTPKILNDLQSALAEGKVEFLVVNKQTDSKIVTTIKATAKDYHVPMLYVTETVPAHQTYTTWMLAQLNDLEKIQTKVAKK